MTKRSELSFLNLYSYILEDVASIYPQDRQGWLRDFKRLKTTFANRGDNLFLVDLPALDKWFISCLEAGTIVPTSLALSSTGGRSTKIPRLFRGLWSRVFADDGCLLSNVDVEAIGCLRTLYCACGKYRRLAPQSALFKTTKEYYDVDNSLPPEPLVWGSDGSDLCPSGLGSLADAVPTILSSIPDRTGDAALLRACQIVFDKLSLLIGDFVPGELGFRHGPGATAEFKRGGKYKYAFRTWSTRLQHVFPAEQFAFANASVLGMDFSADSLLRISEPASRLIAVPKTQKAPRLIAAEPVANQWCQQALASFLGERVRDTFMGQSIDFRRQDISGGLAVTASISGELATVDLSSASDRVSCWLVQRAFRKNLPLLAGLIATRTRFITQNIDKKMPSLHRLNKFSSMGSALTFPIESILFFGICLAAGAYSSGIVPRDENLSHIPEGKLKRLGRQVQVFGDDIIVPVDWVGALRQLLTLLHLKVNDAKTFVNGKFRESCGTDAYMGEIVTPVRVLQGYQPGEPSALASLVEVSNNFHLRGYWKTAAYIMSQVPEHFQKDLLVSTARKITSEWGRDGQFGLKSFVGNSNGACKTRYNHGLQRNEVRALQVTAASGPERYEGTENLLQFFTEDPTRKNLPEWESGKFSIPQPKLRLRWVASE